MTRKHFLAGGPLLLAVACAAISPAFAQTKDLKFEAAVIRPIGGGGAPVPFNGKMFLPGGVFRDPGITLRELLDVVYDVKDSGGLKIIGLPKWAEDTVYSFNAKAGPDYPAVISDRQNEDNVKAMIRGMLADRFQLMFHEEDRKADVMILQVKGGTPKLKPVAAPVPPEKAGYASVFVTDRRGVILGKKTTIAELSRSLGSALKRRVEDQTGLAGFYDFEERWEEPQREGVRSPESTTSPEALAQLISVLNQNLGLVLKTETKHVPFWVVDHVEMPGEN